MQKPKFPLSHELVLMFNQNGVSRLFHRGAVQLAGLKPGQSCDPQELQHLRRTEEDFSLQLLAAMKKEDFF